MVGVALALKPALQAVPGGLSARSGCAGDDSGIDPREGSLVVMPTVAGFLFALWLALAQSFV
jgi:hypothetical protein